MNLLVETKEFMDKINKTINDIIFIGSTKSYYSCTWDEYKKLADMDYDNGYGSQIIASDLVIIFKGNSVMSRISEYGAECWQYQSFDIKTNKPLKINKLYTDDEQIDLKSINTL